MGGAMRQVVVTEGELGTATEAENENRTALTRVLEQHRKRLVLAALRITRNRDEAEDVVQEAAMKALVKLQTFRGESRLETWIYTIVGNCALSRLRSPARRRLISLDSELNADQNSPRWVALEATDPEGNCLAYELGWRQSTNWALVIGEAFLCQPMHASQSVCSTDCQRIFAQAYRMPARPSRSRERHLSQVGRLGSQCWWRRATSQAHATNHKHCHGYCEHE